MQYFYFLLIYSQVWKTVSAQDINYNLVSNDNRLEMSCTPNDRGQIKQTVVPPSGNDTASRPAMKWFCSSITWKNIKQYYGLPLFERAFLNTDLFMLVYDRHTHRGRRTYLQESVPSFLLPSGIQELSLGHWAGVNHPYQLSFYNNLKGFFKE